MTTAIALHGSAADRFEQVVDKLEGSRALHGMSATGAARPADDPASASATTTAVWPSIVTPTMHVR